MATEEEQRAQKRAVHAEFDRIYRERAAAERALANSKAGETTALHDELDHPASDKVFDMSCPSTETSFQKLLRANRGSASRPPPGTRASESELGMSYKAFDALSSGRKLEIANRIETERRRAAAGKSTR